MLIYLYLISKVVVVYNFSTQLYYHYILLQNFLYTDQIGYLQHFRSLLGSSTVLVFYLLNTKTGVSVSYNHILWLFWYIRMFFCCLDSKYSQPITSNNALVFVKYVKLCWINWSSISNASWVPKDPA